MLLDTLERVNRLRQQALNNPDFMQSAQAHASAIDASERPYPERSSLPKSLADIYKEAHFEVTKASTHH